MNYLVIPAYEPDEHLLKLLSDISWRQSFKILVVNDGSSEKYDEIFECAKKYATVLKHEKNMGKGAALKTAFSYILKENDEKWRIVVTADADGQHLPEDILAVSGAAASHLGELVIGSRRLKGKVPLKSRLGNIISRYAFFLSTGKKVYDTQSGLRGFPAGFLQFMCGVEGERYEYEMNMLLAGTEYFPVREVPIKTVYLNKNAASHFRPFRDAVLIYEKLLRFAAASFIGFLLDYSIYALLITLLGQFPVESRLMISNILARICSASANYAINRNYVFRDRGSVLKTGAEYFALSGFILLTGTLALTAVGGSGLINPYTAKLLVDGSMFFVSWFIQQRFIFKRKGHAEL